MPCGDLSGPLIELTVAERLTQLLDPGLGRDAFQGLDFIGDRGAWLVFAVFETDGGHFELSNLLGRDVEHSHAAAAHAAAAHTATTHAAHAAAHALVLAAAAKAATAAVAAASAAHAAAAKLGQRGYACKRSGQFHVQRLVGLVFNQYAT